uniref:Secreted protein n=1 Tax=Echinococcus granulosus TaxID=6210 RepID=A0A068WYB6_ECHGR|nr:hypothetical protein EgrG_002007900 [Echinococcus granulosus]
MLLCCGRWSKMSYLPPMSAWALVAHLRCFDLTWRRWQSRFPQPLQPQPQPTIEKSSKKGFQRIFCCFRG